MLRSAYKFVGVTGSYVVVAKVNSNAATEIKSREFTVTVSMAAATGVEIEYVDGSLERVYGNNNVLELAAIVDEGASADSATWFINDEPQHFATGAYVEVSAEMLRNVGEYIIKVIITGEKIYDDSVTVVVSPYEILVTPI